MECLAFRFVFNSNGDLFISSFSDDNIVKVSNLPVGVEDENNFTPDDPSLLNRTIQTHSIHQPVSYQSHPSPSEVEAVSIVSLKVYDVLGNEVATLVNEEKPAGNYEVKFTQLDLSSGIYFYQLSAGSFVETKKMILLR